MIRKLHAVESRTALWGRAPKSLVLVKHDHEGCTDERLIPVDDCVLDQGFFGTYVQNNQLIRIAYAAPNGNRVARAHVWPRMRVFYDSDERGATIPPVMRCGSRSSTA